MMIILAWSIRPEIRSSVLIVSSDVRAAEVEARILNVDDNDNETNVQRISQ
jgi:hypothetical protein